MDGWKEEKKLNLIYIGSKKYRRTHEMPIKEARKR